MITEHQLRQKIRAALTYRDQEALEDACTAFARQCVEEADLDHGDCTGLLRAQRGLANAVTIADEELQRLPEADREWWHQPCDICTPPAGSEAGRG